MTTVCTDGTQMAGDRRVTSGTQLLSDDTCKVYRAADGSVFGSSGSTADCARYTRWMVEGGEKPDIQGDFNALILRPDGTVWLVYKCLEPIATVAPQAIGSGGDIAIGALLMGASVRAAVECAASRDVHTGPDVTVLGC